MQTDIFFMWGGREGGTARIVLNILGAVEKNFAPSYVTMTDRPNINFTAGADNRFSKNFPLYCKLTI
jgi:hypothetical protein